MMTVLLLAAAAAGGVDGVTLTAAGVTALGIAAVGIVKAFRSGEAKGAAARRVQVEDQPIHIQQNSPNATQGELATLKIDIDQRLAKIEAALSDERSVARVALGRIHARLDAATTATAELKGGLDKVADNVDRLLVIALNRTPRTRA